MASVSNSNRVVATVNALVNDVKLINQENVVTIDTSNTRLGIKTANPLSELHVDGNVYITGKLFFLSNDADVDPTEIMDGSRKKIEFVAGGSYVTPSDIRLKHDIIDISNGLEIIDQLNPIFYKRTKNFDALDNSGNFKEPYILEAGLIAQEIYKINDLSYSVVKGTDTKPFYLNYNNIFIYALSAIKQLSDKVNYLEEKISKLEKK